MARPPKYSPTLVKKATQYLSSYKEQGDAVPSVEGMAYFLGVSRDTVYAWAKEHQEFSDIVDKLRTSKSRALQNGGLTNALNASVAKLLLGHEGYRESQDVTTDGKAMPAQVLVRFLGDDEQDNRNPEGV